MSRVQSQPGAPFLLSSPAASWRGSAPAPQASLVLFWGLARQSQDLEQSVVRGGRQREGEGGGRTGMGGGGVGGGRVSQSSALPSDQREGNTYNFPFWGASLPLLLFRFLPLWTGDGSAGGLGRGRRPGTRPTGPSPGSVLGLAGSRGRYPACPSPCQGGLTLLFSKFYNSIVCCPAD